MKKSLPNPYLLGGLVFCIQLALILIIITQDKSLGSAWLSLANHWDSEWYEAIAKFGYINIDGPQNTGLQNANVVFFPGYPYLARIITSVFHIEAKVAILIISQTFCMFFWITFCKVISNAKKHQQIIAILLVAFYPCNWFLYTAYAESTFIFTTVFSLWMFINNKWLTASIAAIFMTATRIIGTPVLIVPMLSIIYINRKKIFDSWKQEQFHEIFNILFKPTLFGLIGVIGVLGFLIYCHIEFNSWHLYFDMEEFGWKGKAYPLFIFKSTTWLPPPFGYDLDLAPVLPNVYGKIFPNFFRLAAYTLSETLVPIFIWLGLAYSFCLYIARDKINISSLTWYLSAILILIFSCLSLYTRYYESMSRCLYPVWILLILSDISHPSKVLLFKLPKNKLLYVSFTLLAISGGYWLQLLLRFNLGWWVA